MEYNEKEAPIRKSLSKLELLDRLGVIESELKTISNVQQGKSIAKCKVLVEELKRRVEISPENIHNISLDLPCPTRICASYNYTTCVSLQPEEVVSLENQLNAALMHLSAEEDDNSEVMSSESTIDTISDSGTEEDKSTVIHNNEVIFISKNQVTSTTTDSSDIFTSTKKNNPFPTDKVTTKSSRRYKGILMNSMGNGNGKQKDNSRNVRTVRFCNQCSVHHIAAEPTPEDRLARARRLIKEARNSRQTLVGATVQDI